MPHPNALVIERLFAALNQHDHGAMAACYRDAAVFHDIAFHFEDRSGIHDMWRMICLDSAIQVELQHVEADEYQGEAIVVDRYRFGRRRRPVVNRITSRFWFEDGRIKKQVDDCDARAWAAQALGGVPGWIAGRSRRVRRAAAWWMLHQYLRHHPSAGQPLRIA